MSDYKLQALTSNKNYGRNAKGGKGELVRRNASCIFLQSDPQQFDMPSHSDGSYPKTSTWLDLRMM